MSVFVAPSIWREINVVTATRLFVAMSGAPQAEKVIWAPLWNDALLGRSRSILTSEFLKTDADVMVIIDEDIVWDDPADFWKIVEGCRDTHGIYGGAYVTRSTQPHLSSRVYPGTEYAFAQGPVRRPVEIQYLATGFFAVHRDVVEKMRGARFEDADGGHLMAEVTLGADRPFYPFFSPFTVEEADGQRHYLSEDWAFCNRARQLGSPVHMDQSIVLKHMGLYPYTVKDLLNPGDAFEMRSIEWTVAHSEPRQYGEPLIDNLIADVAEFAEEDLGDTRRMLESGRDMTALLWKTRPKLQTEPEWYAREDVGFAYLGELAQWHLNGGVPWQAFGELTGSLYDHGAGIGTLALVAAKRGATVTAFEPNPVMREFIAWRAAKYGLNVTVLDAPASGQFDAIACWHVFEHLEEPERALDDLLAMLRPGGLFITDSGFDDHDAPQHHEHPDWDGVLASRGLVSRGTAMFSVEAVAA